MPSNHSIPFHSLSLFLAILKIEVQESVLATSHAATQMNGNAADVLNPKIVNAANVDPCQSLSPLCSDFNDSFIVGELEQGTKIRLTDVFGIGILLGMCQC